MWRTSWIFFFQLSYCHSHLCYVEYVQLPGGPTQRKIERARKVTENKHLRRATKYKKAGRVNSPLSSTAYVLASIANICSCGCNSVIQRVLSMCEALSLIISTKKKKERTNIYHATSFTPSEKIPYSGRGCRFLCTSKTSRM